MRRPELVEAVGDTQLVDFDGANFVDRTGQVGRELSGSTADPVPTVDVDMTHIFGSCRVLKHDELVVLVLFKI